MLNLKKFIGTGVAIIATLTAASLYSATTARSSDHQDSDAMVARPSADITDVFMFPSAQTTDNVVMIMDTHPLIPTGMGTSTFFDPAVLYQLKIVHSDAAYTPGQANAAVEDTVIQFTVNGSTNSQKLTMRGPAAPARAGTTNDLIASSASSTINYNSATTLNVTGADGKSYPVKVFAGPRADPFYFDLAQFFKIIPDRSATNSANGATAPAATASSFRGFTAAFNTTNGTSCDVTPAHDFITSGGADAVSGASGGFNVLALVVEMPKALLQLTPGTSVSSKPFVHLWATTSTTSGS